MSKKEPAAEQKPPNPETLKLAFEESKAITLRLEDAIGEIDRKIVILFTLSAAIAGLAPALSGTAINVWAWRIGGLAWGMGAIACLLGYWPRNLSVSPNPNRIYRPRWLAIETDEYRLKRLGTMRHDYSKNKSFLDAKARWLRWAMVAVALEIAMFVAALTF